VSYYPGEPGPEDLEHYRATRDAARVEVERRLGRPIRKNDPDLRRIVREVYREIPQAYGLGGKKWPEWLPAELHRIPGWTDMWR
jgi:hypothetical protein